MRLHQKPPTSRNRLLQRHDLLNFVTTLYEGDLHAKRVLSLANATLGVLASASLAIHAVGRGLAQAMGTLTKHGVKQVDRLLSNRGVDVGTFFAYWTPYIGLCLPGRSEKIREVVCRFGAHVPIRAVWLARAADWAVRRRPGARMIRGTSASSNRTARSAGCVVNWRAPPATGTDGSVAANASRSNSTRRGGPAADRQPPLPRTGRKVAAGIPDGGLAHATVGRAAARARDRSTRPSRRRCRRRVRTAAARLT